MKWILKRRQEGKTTDLVKWVREGEITKSYPFWSRVIVTSSEREAQRLRREFKLEYRQVFSFWDFRAARWGSLPIEVAVDNADLVLQDLLNYPIAILSGTVDSRSTTE